MIWVDAVGLARVDRYLFFAGAQAVAVALAVVWGLSVIAALIGGLAVGLPEELGLELGPLAGVAVVTLPQSLQIAMPLAVGHAVLRLREDGELLAARLAGTTPVRIGLALLAPLLPCLWLLHDGVHHARPVAFRDLRSMALATSLGDAAILAGTLEAVGVGTMADDHGWRALWPLGEAAVAVSLAAAPSIEGDELVASPGRIAYLAPAEEAVLPPTTGSFDGFRLSLPDRGRGWVDHDESELTTAWLEEHGRRWARQRIAQGQLTADRALTVELGQRGWTVPAAWLALLLAAWPLWSRSAWGARAVYAGAVAPAVAIAVFVPRWMSQW